MPITVNCPSCSVTFKTKDEYAGKRAKCPKCGEPLTIPAVVDTVLMPPPAKVAAPVAARPVSASKPKPVADDEADEAPKPKRRRDEDDDDAPVSPKRKRGAADEDDNPRAKKGKGDDEDARPARKRGASDEDEKPRSRKRGDDANDDKPRSRRRRDDDDEPKKKSKTLPIILGIVGGLLLLCGGGCAGVYFGVIVPAAEKAKKLNDEKQAELDRWAKEANKPNLGPGPGPGPNLGQPDTPGKVTKQNLYGKLSRGDKIAKVEQQLGKGRQADVPTVAGDAAKLLAAAEMKKRWEQHAALGNVYRFDNGPDRVLCVFDQSPDLDGKLIAVLTTFGGITESIFDPPVVLETVTITAQALAAEFDADPKAAEAKYKDKLLKLSGKLVEVTRSNDLYFEGLAQGKMKGKVVVKIGLTYDDWKLSQTLKPGDTVTLTCKIGFTPFKQDFKDSPWEVRLSDGRLQK